MGDKSKYSFRNEAVVSGLETYPELLRTLLASRGIVTAKEAEKFLNPSYVDHTHDPFLLKDMDKAVSRILTAIDNKEKILIYSDYDADGIPGGALLHDFFKKIGYSNFINYIPDRHDEGYGLNIEAIENFAKDGVKLLITVDCGIVDKKEILRANELSMDVIVTDHHLPQGDLPQAFAVINPKRIDCEYPYDMLCGSGVAFKLIQGILNRRDFGLGEGKEKWFLDLVGVATLSDMVPLTGENRVFAFYGLKVLKKSPRHGLRKLFSKLKINHLTEDDIGFMLTPRINAASRMGMPVDAFRLLVTDDESEADVLSDHLNKINDERKGVVASIVKDVKKHLAGRQQSDAKNVIVVGNPDWKPSLLGLVANSLMEEYSKPVFIWGRDGGSELKGSCRSDGSINLVLLMDHAKESFLAYGGHSMAGGFSVTNKNIHTLEDVLDCSYETIRNGEDFQKEKVWIDKRIFLDDVNWNTYSVIEKLAPFGMGNPKPTFILENLMLDGVKMFGKERNHLELTFLNSGNKKISAIGFFMSEKDFELDLKQGRRINLVATIEKSMFRNFPELRLRIVDIF